MVPSINLLPLFKVEGAKSTLGQGWGQGNHTILPSDEKVLYEWQVHRGTGSLPLPCILGARQQPTFMDVCSVPQSHDCNL